MSGGERRPVSQHTAHGTRGSVEWRGGTGRPLKTLTEGSENYLDASSRATTSSGRYSGRAPSAPNRRLPLSVPRNTSPLLSRRSHTFPRASGAHRAGSFRWASNEKLGASSATSPSPYQRRQMAPRPPSSPDLTAKSRSNRAPPRPRLAHIRLALLARHRPSKIQLAGVSRNESLFDMGY